MATSKKNITALTERQTRMCGLTGRSFVHKVQFVVEVGQLGVLLFDDERDVVQQRDLPVGGLGVQQLSNTKDGC